MRVLDGIRVVEISTFGAVHFSGMLLADLGADVITVERPDADVGRPRPTEIVKRGKRSIVLDLKKPEAIDIVLRLVERADALIENMRPGVMERLGLSPDICLGRQPALVYGRLTGMGQEGPLAHVAGYESTFTALSGSLWLSSPPGQRPEAPPTLVGDVAGGALYLTIGVLAAVLRARQHGFGQVVDAAMLDGSANILAMTLATIARDGGNFERGKPAADARHFARSYRCRDGEWINVLPIDSRFYAEFIQRLGLDTDERFVNGQDMPESWASLSEELAALFAHRTRDEWCALFEGSDACVAPVLSPPEAALHPHNVARGIYATVNGVLQPSPAPRFSATPSSAPSRVPERGAHGYEIMREIGIDAREIDRLRSSGVLG